MALKTLGRVADEVYQNEPLSLVERLWSVLHQRDQDRRQVVVYGVVCEAEGGDAVFGVDAQP